MEIGDEVTLLNGMVGQIAGKVDGTYVNTGERYVNYIVFVPGEPHLYECPDWQMQLVNEQLRLTKGGE